MFIAHRPEDKCDGRSDKFVQISAKSACARLVMRSVKEDGGLPRPQFQPPPVLRRFDALDETSARDVETLFAQGFGEMNSDRYIGQLMTPAQAHSYIFITVRRGLDAYAQPTRFIRAEYLRRVITDNARRNIARRALLEDYFERCGRLRGDDGRHTGANDGGFLRRYLDYRWAKVILMIERYGSDRDHACACGG